MKLYHGTAARHLNAILKDGIRPRGRNGRHNWKHTVESNPDFVYLTNAYGLHFAHNGTPVDGGELAIIEIDTVHLNPFCLHPDEDYLEQATRKTIGGTGTPYPTLCPAPPHGLRDATKLMHWRTRWYRKRLRTFRDSWELSLNGMGTCTHEGVISPEAITQIVTMPVERCFDFMIFCGLDPQISVLNYRHVGARYRNSMRRLFGHGGMERDDMDEAAATLMSPAQREKIDAVWSSPQIRRRVLSAGAPVKPVWPAGANVEGD